MISFSGPDQIFQDKEVLVESFIKEDTFKTYLFSAD